MYNLGSVLPDHRQVLKQQQARSFVKERELHQRPPAVTYTRCAEWGSTESCRAEQAGPRERFHRPQSWPQIAGHFISWQAQAALGSTVP